MSLFVSPIKSSDIIVSSGKIYGFFHIGFMNNWEYIFNSLVKDLENSGLLKATEKVFVGTAGIPPSDFVLPEKFFLVKQNLVLEDGENETIKSIHSLRMRLKGNKIWYIHTKGASRKDFGMDSWRDFMVYFVVKNWKNCIRALQLHDICGVSWHYIRKDKKVFLSERVRKENLYDQVQGRFSGNFWWANGDYLSKIDTPFPSFNPYAHKRHLSEFFLGRHSPIVYDFCDICHLTKGFGGDYYGVYIDPKWYEQPYFIL